MSVLTAADLSRKVPSDRSLPAAFVDNNGGIWLWEPDLPSEAGRWRIPGGVVAKPGNRVLDLALSRQKVTRLTRLSPMKRKDGLPAIG